MKKGTKLYSILTGTCPACQSSKMYKYGPYNLSHMTKIKSKCDKCNQTFNPEPSFFTGAMYVSYAFAVALVISVFVAFNVLSDTPSVNWMIFTVSVIAIITGPLNLRLSRNIWINLFVKYKK